MAPKGKKAQIIIVVQVLAVDREGSSRPCCLQSRKPVDFWIRKSGFLGRVKGDVNNWNKNGVRTTAMVILGITSVGGRCTVIGKSEGPCFSKKKNFYGRGRLIQRIDSLIKEVVT